MNERKYCLKSDQREIREGLSLLRDGIFALLAPMALVLDLNLRSGNNYVNMWSSLPDIPVMAACAAMLFYILRRARKQLPASSGGMRLLSLFLGAWSVIARSVANTKDLNQPFLSSSQMLKSVIITLGMACLYNLLFRLMEHALSGDADIKPCASSRLVNLYRRSPMLVCTAAVLLMWLPQIVVSYPVAMNDDTASQVNQALGLSPWQANHPPFGTWLLSVALCAGRMIGNYGAGLYLYVLVQTLFAALVIGYSHGVMRKLGAPRWLRAASLFICGTMPVFSGNVTVLIKDIPYSYAALLLLCEAVRVLLLREDGYAAAPGHLLRMALSGVVLMNIRNNGLGILLPVGVYLLAHALKHNNKKKTLIRAVLAVLLPFLLSACIESALMNRSIEVEKRSPREALSLPFQQTARFIREHGDSIPQEEREAIDAVLLYDRIGDFYNPVLSDPVKGTYKEDASMAELLRYFGVWGRQLLRDPGCYLKATLIQNALLFDPQTLNVAIFRETGLHEEAQWVLNVQVPAVLSRLEQLQADMFWLMNSIPLVAQLNSLGFYCIVFVGTYAICRKQKIRGLGIVFVPLFITMAMIVLGPCIENQDRYGFPIIYCMPLVLACVSYAIQKKNA